MDFTQIVKILSKFGAYLSHLIALSEDSTVKLAKLRGYCIKWADARYILGCAFYSDLLSPCAIFSQVLQSDTLDILGAFTSLLRTIQELNKLNSKKLEQWPSYSAICKSLTQEDDKKLYQQQVLRNHDAAIQYFTSHCGEFCAKVTSYLKSRLEWTDTQFIRDVIIFLATQGWQKLADEQSEYGEAIVRLYTIFTIPLEAADVVVGLIVSEFNDILSCNSVYITVNSELSVCLVEAISLTQYV